MGYKVSQAGKQSRRFSDIIDALRIGELMQIDNPYDDVFFEEEMRGQYVPCGCFRALALKPAGFWRGVAFGAYYCTGEDGSTRQLTWDEQWVAIQDGRTSLHTMSPTLRHALAETERSKIKDALVAAGWNVSKAAEKLRLPRTTLLSRMERLNILTPRRQQTAAA